MQELSLFDQLKADIQVVIDPCLSTEVTSDETANGAMALAREIKTLAKRIEDRRKEMVAPLNDQVKKINAYAKSIAEPIEQAERHLKKQLGSWADVLEERRLKALAEAEEERKRKEAEIQAKLREEEEERQTLAMFRSEKENLREEIIAKAQGDRAIAAVTDIHSSNVKDIASMKVAGAKKLWKFEIEDAEKVPRAYLCVDERAVRDAIMKGERSIPGVRIYQETSIAIGGIR